MPVLANVLVAAKRHRNVSMIALWGTLFLAFLGVGWGILLWQLGASSAQERANELQHIFQIRRNAISALEQLHAEVKAPPCSSEFMSTLSKIAFLPDGLNVFLYAPNGVVACGTGLPEIIGGLELGPPDIAGHGEKGLQLWIDRELKALGWSAEQGTILALGAFAVVVPQPALAGPGPKWLVKRLVAVRMGGRLAPSEPNELLRQMDLTGDVATRYTPTAVEGVTCGALGFYCVASRAELGPWARDWFIFTLAMVALAMLLAWFCTVAAFAWLDRYWSFEARFLRNLDSVTLNYQPIIDVQSGAVAGCEVLARWRDVDGSIVTPDRFLDIVETRGRTAEFTQMVADTAWRELSELVPNGKHLQVNFNVFGCDFDTETMLAMFAKFDKTRFTVGLELVEDQQVGFEDARKAMVALRRAGMKIYIDDFGVGYSSIERVATFPVDGVKLDRSFAMASPDSVLGRMLIQVLELLKVTRTQIVVEGIETFQWLHIFRASGNVDLAQGYAIACPLGISDFASFLKAPRHLREGRVWAA